MEVFVWLFIYLIFTIISTVLTSKRKPRKTLPTTTYRREPPIIIKTSPGKENNVDSSSPDYSTIEITPTFQAPEVEFLSSQEITKGGLLTALPLDKNSVVFGVIFKEILGPPKSLQIRRNRY